MTPDVKLSPCPFCAGTNIRVRYDRDDPEYTFAECDTCQTQGPVVISAIPDTKQRAIERWNRRPTAQGGAQEGVVVPASKLLELRHALVSGSVAEAYHVLYSIASPHFNKLEPWAELEALSASQWKECETCKVRPGLVRVTDGNPMLGSWDLCPDCKTCHECNGTGQRKETP